MAQQKVFKEAYVDVLRDSVEPEKYAGECFEYDESQVKPLANVHQPVDLLDKMDPDNLLESAIALFEAYKDLTPLAASKIELWAYLSHVDLFGFMQKWYPEVTEGKADARFIRDRWFRSPKGADPFLPWPDSGGRYTARLTKVVKTSTNLPVCSSGMTISGPTISAHQRSFVIGKRSSASWNSSLKIRISPMSISAAVASTLFSISTVWAPSNNWHIWTGSSSRRSS